MEFDLTKIKEAFETESQNIQQQKERAREHFKENVDKERRKAQILQDVITRVENSLPVPITQEMQDLEIVPDVMKILTKYSNFYRFQRLFGKDSDDDDDISNLWPSL